MGEVLVDALRGSQAVPGRTRIQEDACWGQTRLREVSAQWSS